MYLCEVDGFGKCVVDGGHPKWHVRSIPNYEKRTSSSLLVPDGANASPFLDSSSVYVPGVRQEFPLA